MRLDAVDLVANDTGGAIAQVFAARHPERLRTLTLTNCEVHDNLPPEEFAPVVEMAERGELAPTGPALAADPAAARATTFAATYEHPDRIADETIRAFLEPVVGTLERGREFERFLTSLRAEDLVAVEPQLGKLEVPTLIAWGTADTTFGIEWAHRLRDTIPGAELAEIPGGRLFFPQERAAELAAHLRRHWSR
jgi:pimeloyl-ACP methyl ester carboxylesterase